MTAEAGDWDRWEDSHAKAQRREDVWTESFPKLCVLASLREKMDLWQTPDPA